MKFWKRKKVEEKAYTVDIQNLIVHRYSGLNKPISKIKCPRCGVALDNLPLGCYQKCFLCALEMKRTELFKLRCSN